jgi:hypothetical protein
MSPKKKYYFFSFAIAWVINKCVSYSACGCYNLCNISLSISFVHLRHFNFSSIVSHYSFLTLKRNVKQQYFPSNIMYQTAPRQVSQVHASDPWGRRDLCKLPVRHEVRNSAKVVQGTGKIYNSPNVNITTKYDLKHIWNVLIRPRINY